MEDGCLCISVASSGRHIGVPPRWQACPQMEIIDESVWRHHATCSYDNVFESLANNQLAAAYGDLLEYIRKVGTEKNSTRLLTFIRCAQDSFCAWDYFCHLDPNGGISWNLWRSIVPVVVLGSPCCMGVCGKQ